MLLFQKFLSRLYLRKVLLLFVAFELFFVGFDLLRNLKRLPDSANLQILYAVNKFLEFINYTLPLSLIFALLLAMLQIIKSNELVTLYALGVSKERVVKPFVIIASLLTLLYIGLNTLPYFVQSLETTNNIRRMGTISSVSASIFLKSGENYAYIEQLNPHDKSAIGMKIFKIDDGKLTEIIEAGRGHFRNDHWELEDVTIMHKPHITPDNVAEVKLTITTHKTRDVLRGFTPRIIDTLFQSSPRLTIQDSFSALTLLGKQNLRTEKIRANLYMMLFFPLFAPITLFGLFFLFPPQHRGANLPLFTTLVIFGTLVVWGILFTLTQIALNGAISPEAGIILPIVLLSVAAWYIYRKYR
ncbi:MAG TPA: YjgP/YjgQ family permease [Campylobacteraceae bacterium]|nr:YjgP/YjgQ family permease [Campylobacteraceae bacterium]HHD84089.1 YjgP/YjgQ family permease [Campylobacteraceae bacterium]